METEEMIRDFDILLSQQRLSNEIKQVGVDTGVPIYVQSRLIDGSMLTTQEAAAILELKEENKRLKAELF